MIHPEQQAIEAMKDMKDMKDIEDTKTIEAPVETELVHPPTSPQQAGALVHGPHSFVDSTRVHAGEEVAEALAHDPDAASHVPEDLWREDLVGIKKHKKEHKHEIRRRKIDLAGSRSIRRKRIIRRPRPL